MFDLSRNGIAVPFYVDKYDDGCCKFARGENLLQPFLTTIFSSHELHTLFNSVHSFASIADRNSGGPP
ncbi:hypothetical protein RRF57_008614 [Xylaria bambusicola]|uniref:Uncharacterized protein n=1 Tax=Xylaria bambusicola TaxID=326684 RepID=A0AAN7Z0V3_9PEZI